LLMALQRPNIRPVISPDYRDGHSDDL